MPRKNDSAGKNLKDIPVDREMAEVLFTSIDHNLPLNLNEKNDLIDRLTQRTIRRRQFILQDRDICRHYTFIAKGCFKKFYVDERGIEHNLQFAAEGDWIMEIESF